MLAQEAGGLLPNDSHQFQDEINEAIIASLMNNEQNAEEEQILREVMKISALEHQKQIGALNLDHLKKKNKLNTTVKNADLSDISNTFAANRGVGAATFDLPPIEGKGGKGKLPSLPPPRVTKKMQQRMEEDEDTIEERKFLEIINQSSALPSQQPQDPSHYKMMANDESLEMPSSIKKLPVKIKDDGTGFKKQSTKKNGRGGYDDEDEAFNDILNSSPKKKPGQSTIKKDREWEKLERQQNEGGAMNGFDDLLEDNENPDISYGGQSPAIVNKDLSSDLMKERKASVINQGISLYPTHNVDQQKSVNNNSFLPAIGGGYKGSSQRTGTSTLDLHQTEISKGNVMLRSKMDIEESYPTHDLYNMDDDDDFDKLIGHIEKSSGIAPNQANVASSKQTTQRAKAEHHFNDDEDFF